MAATLDTTLIGSATGNGVNSYTLSNFSTGGTNRLVLVISDETQDASTISSVTAPGLPFSKITSVAKGTTQGNVEMWGAWAAAQQTNVAITINFTGTNFPQASATTYCFSGTDTTGTVAAAIGATNTFSSGVSGSTAPTASITTTRANSLCIAGIGSDGLPTVTAGTNQTIDKTVTLTGGFTETNAMRQNAVTTSSGTSVTMNASLSVQTPCGLLAIEILAPTSSANTVNVSDSTTASESIKLLMESNINKSDSSSLTENIVLTEIDNINVSDSDTLTESIKLLSEENIRVSDASSLTESITQLIPTLLMVVSDTSTSSESIGLLETSFINVSDSSTASESIQVFETINVSNIDATSLSESIQLSIVSFVNTNDSTVTSENVDITRNNSRDITISDASTLSESIKLLDELNINLSSIVAVNNILTAGDNVDRTSYTTASITPKSNNLTLAWVYSIAATAPNTPAATGNGITWVQVASVIDSGNLRRITLFRSLDPAPTPGGITFDFAGQTQTGAAWSIANFPGVDVSGSNGSGAIVQSNTNFSAGNATSLTITLGAFSSVLNATAGGFGIPLNTASLPAVGAAFTSIGQVNQSTPNLAMGSEYALTNQTSVNMTSAASSVPWVGIAIEVAAQKYADLSTTSENVSITSTNNALQISVNDSTTLTESVQLLETISITVSDTTILSENTSVSSVEIISVSDSTSTNESIQLSNTESIQVNDGTSILESIQLLIPTLFISVTDSSATSENVNVQFSGIFTVSVSDSTNTSENTQLFISDSVNVSDSSTTSENVNLLVSNFITKSDTVTTTESIKVLLSLNISVSDSANITENIIFFEPTYDIGGLDTITTTENIQVYAAVSFIDTESLVLIMPSVLLTLVIPATINMNAKIG